MDFEELHGKSGSGMNVGVDLTTLMTSQIATSTAGESGGGGSGGGDMTVPRIASFQVYWDVQGKQFKVFSPKVVDPNGNEIAVTETALSRGTYVCEVKKDKTTNVYTAAIKLIGPIVPSDETVTVVKIFKLEDGKVEQYHVGAIILGDKKGGSSSNPAAFDLEVSESSTGTKTGKIVRCNFVFDGENKSLPDFSVSGSGSVYLVAKQPAPSGGAGDLPWTFEISESEGEAAEGGRVVNYKLYDLSDFAVTCDYRTTFMELKSPHKVAKFVVERYDGEDGSIELDATIEGNPVVRVSGDGDNYARLYASSNSAAAKGLHVNSGSSQARLLASSTSAYLSLSGTQSSYVSIKGGQKSVLIDPSNLENGNEAKFHKLTVKHADPNKEDDKYDVLADKDIIIYEGAAAERLTAVDLELNGETNLRLKLTFTDKDGNTRDEYSTGLTLKQVDVVSDVNWSSPTLSKSGKKVTVIEEASGGENNVFTAVAHSTNHNS